MSFSDKKQNIPNFFIVGAPKCGTTSLSFYLSQHPQVCLSQPKEPHFFDFDFDKGLDYYRQKYFSHYQGEVAAGEATVDYLMLPFVPPRIKQTIPDARIIVILRNPVERAYSEWWMQKSRGVEKLSFGAAVFENYKRIKSGINLQDRFAPWLWQGHINLIRAGKLHLRTYLDAGHYVEHLEHYFRFFSKDQVKVLFFEDLKSHPVSLLHDVQRFLGINHFREINFIPKNKGTSRAYAVINLGRALGLRHLPRPAKSFVKNFLRKVLPRPSMSSEIREWLLEYYAPYNKKLARLLGINLNHWLG